MKRSYSKMKHFQTYEERLAYLDCAGMVGQETFGYERALNQRLYHSPEWRALRHKIILRDSGLYRPYDLGIEGREIDGPVFIHHINPITPEDFKMNSSKIWDPDNLICCSRQTHEIIHYGYRLAEKEFDLDGERFPDDTTPWR